MRYIIRARRLLLGLALVAVGSIVLACGGSTEDPGKVHVLTWDGIVNPVMERYIDRGIRTAERSDAAAVVIRLDTPGGLDSAMRDIIQRIEAATVPIIVYVSPAGGRAASAGTYITMSAHVAAMAPNTTIGAATPINSDGSDIEGALGRKVINDAVAYIRGIAELRGRNADWGEDAVRNGTAVPENEAVSLNVVNFVAPTLEDLLRQSQGLVVEVPDENGVIRDVTLAVSDAPIHDNGVNVFERLLYLIADPNIAFLLISLGGLAIVAEIFSTNGVTGIFGAIALVLAFFALGSLPTNWAGVALITFGFVLISLELLITGFGALGVGGIVALLLGGLILTGSSETGFQVSRWLVIGTAATIGVLTLGFIGLLMKARKMPVHSGRETLVGAKGFTRGCLAPNGPVLVQGERWDAVAEDPPLEENTPIIVTAAEGFHLQVKRDPASIPLLPEGRAAPPSEAVTPTAPA